MKTSVITFYSKGDTVIFLISTLILQHNLFVTQFINYCILSRTVFYLLFIAEAIVFLVAFALTSRANRQAPFTLTTKNVLQFTLRRRTVDLVKKNVKGKFQTFCKGMFCFHTGRWQHTCFLFWLCYKRNSKRCSCATIELWMHLDGWQSYASLMLSNLLRGHNSMDVRCTFTIS